MTGADLLIDNRRDTLEVTVSPRWNAETVVLAIRYGIFWTLVAAIALGARAHTSPPAATRAVQAPLGLIDAIVPLLLLLLILYLAYTAVWGTLSFALWFFRPERLQAAGGLLRLQGLPAPPCHFAVPLADVRGLEIVPVTGKASGTAGWLLIRTARRRYRFGRGLTLEQALAVREALQSHLEYPGRTCL